MRDVTCESEGTARAVVHVLLFPRRQNEGTALALVILVHFCRFSRRGGMFLDHPLEDAVATETGRYFLRPCALCLLTERRNFACLAQSLPHSWEPDRNTNEARRG